MCKRVVRLLRQLFHAPAGHKGIRCLSADPVVASGVGLDVETKRRRCTGIFFRQGSAASVCCTGRLPDLVAIFVCAGLCQLKRTRLRVDDCRALSIRSHGHLPPGGNGKSIAGSRLVRHREGRLALHSARGVSLRNHAAQRAVWVYGQVIHPSAFCRRKSVLIEDVLCGRTVCGCVEFG